MRKYFAFAAFVVLLAGGCAQVDISPPGQTPVQVSPRERAAQLLEAADYLAHIEAVTFSWRDGLQMHVLSGTLREQNGNYYVITVSHITLPEEQLIYIYVYIKRDPQMPLAAELLGYDRRIDASVLLITTDYNFRGKLPRFGDSDQIRAGERVFSLGSPEGAPYQIKYGSIQNPRMRIGIVGLPYQVTVMQHSGALGPGSSGGPVLNESGEIIGITVAGRGQISNASLINNVLDALDEMIAGGKYD